MKRLIAFLVLLLYISGCGGWGGYVFKSEQFKYKFTFPPKWEVIDRSDATGDHLVGNLPDDNFAEIMLTAVPVSPDVSPQEIYLRFSDGGDDATLHFDFEVLETGTINAKNLEGRFILVQYQKNQETMRGIRAKFLSNRFTLEAKADVLEDQYPLQEAVLKKMIRLIEFKN